MKILKVTGIILLVIIILMVILPFLFKDQIIDLVKEKANENLTAVLNFEDAGLNLFSNFPDLTLTLDEMTIVNKAPFEGDTLMYMKEFKASIDLGSVIGGDKIAVEEIRLIEPNIFVYVLEDSTANYNITKPENSAEPKDTAASDMLIHLKEYSIEDGNIAYVDQTSDMTAVIRNINHSGSGNFSQKNFVFETETSIGDLTVEKGKIRYLNHAEAEFLINLDADMGTKKFTFRENEFRINNLLLKFAGDFQMKEESMLMNLNFSSVNNSFKDIISLIPAVYSQKFEDIEASGSMSLKGEVKGEYSEGRLPGININLNVKNGNFKYPKLPTPVQNVAMDMNVSNPGGVPDQTVVNISRLHLEIGGEPFDARLLLKNPVSAPYIDTKMKGRIDLAKLKSAIYLEDVNNLSGIINADFEAKGTVASADQKTIENLSATGTISVNNIIYNSSTLPEEVKVVRGSLVLTPKKFNLSNTFVQIGKSDISAEGQLENMISYVMSDGTIKGNLKLTSNYFNVNPFMKADETTQKTKNDTAKIEAASVPERVNFTMSSVFNTLVYDNLTLTNVKGNITIANERVTLNNVSMNTFGGNILADGFYHAPEGSTPDIMFNLSINGLAFRDAYKSFVSVQRFAPMAQYIDGKFNSKLSLNSKLDAGMQPVWDSFSSKGSFSIQNAAISGFKPLQLAGDKLNLNALKNPSLNNVSTSFTITNGRLYVQPFDFKIADYNVNIGGSNGIDKSIDYTLGVAIPASNLKQEGNKAISGLLGRDLNLITANTINVNAKLGGSIDNPTVSTSAGKIVEETTKQVTQQVEQQVKKEIEKKQEQLTKEGEKQIDTLTNKLKKEAENKLKNIFKFKKP